MEIQKKLIIMKERIKMNEFKYIVWIGEIDDYYVNFEEAKNDYLEWIDKGYDDVILTDINNKILIESEN